MVVHLSQADCAARSATERQHICQFRHWRRSVPLTMPKFDSSQLHHTSHIAGRKSTWSGARPFKAVVRKGFKKMSHGDAERIMGKTLSGAASLRTRIIYSMTRALSDVRTLSHAETTFTKREAGLERGRGAKAALCSEDHERCRTRGTRRAP
jgi:hypothetical protein